MRRSSKQTTRKVPVGRKVRIVGNSNEHNYSVGSVYTVSHIDDSDGTLKADNDAGITGNWIRWCDVAPMEGVGWEFVQKVLPTEVVQFMASFDGVEHLELSTEVKDAILLSLPDLHERILKEASKPKRAEAAVEEDLEELFTE